LKGIGKILCEVEMQLPMMARGQQGRWMKGISGESLTRLASVTAVRRRFDIDFW
jgi:hypothetical protein